MKTENVVDDDYHHAYDDELYPKGNQAPRSPAVPAIILESPLPGRSTQGQRIKIVLPKQMLQRMSVLLPQVEAGNTSENILN